MPNDVYLLVTDELEVHIGDILALGIAKKAVRSLGYSEDYVTKEEIKEALNKHVKTSLGSFMAPAMAHEVIKRIEEKMDSGDDL